MRAPISLLVDVNPYVILSWGNKPFDVTRGGFPCVLHARSGEPAGFDGPRCVGGISGVATANATRHLGSAGGIMGG